ncbi:MULTISPECIES: GNAT family N-acetyltransferase [Bacillaceae]|uniref:Acetyltransferase n=1 Tax=Alkalicoccobacillus plakortidis TaxID=444060 RepID=A0A9D5DQQ2_9BACI|nr:MULTISPECIES: GNAT family N-acetyltransferase [Bacillaceae]KQL58613.1 acetyltransferase [Alkalicoccobacillus plakortidis]
MSKPVRIEEASPHSRVGAKLNIMAIESMAKTIVGSDDPATIEETMRRLWEGTNNRFSHEFAYEAKAGNKTLGMITCYPTSVMNQLVLPTAKQILQIRRFEMIKYAVKNVRPLYAMMTMEEGKKDEFHIGANALLPESRGLGIGGMLLDFAEACAKERSFTKLSLTVRENNPRAKQLYERLGYQVVGKIDRGSFKLSRMVKTV